MNQKENQKLDAETELALLSIAIQERKSKGSAANQHDLRLLTKSANKVLKTDDFKHDTKHINEAEEEEYEEDEQKFKVGDLSHAIQTLETTIEKQVKST